MGWRRSRRLAIRALRAELVMREDITHSAASNVMAGRGGVAGPDAHEALMVLRRRALYKEVAVRAALAAMEEFGLGE